MTASRAFVDPLTPEWRARVDAAVAVIALELAQPVATEAPPILEEAPPKLRPGPEPGLGRDQLSEPERKVLELLETNNHREAGEILGVTHQRIGQIRDRAHAKLWRQLQARKRLEEVEGQQ